jgi:hypothetical protein
MFVKRQVKVKARPGGSQGGLSLIVVSPMHGGRCSTTVVSDGYARARLRIATMVCLYR